METKPDPDLERFMAEVERRNPAEPEFLQGEAALLPVMPIDVEMNGVRLSLFTVIATFGTAQDVTADELRIESLFPADDATEQLFRALASGEAG